MNLIISKNYSLCGTKDKKEEFNGVNLKGTKIFNGTKNLHGAKHHASERNKFKQERIFIKVERKEDLRTNFRHENIPYAKGTNFQDEFLQT